MASPLTPPPPAESILDLIGATPMVRIRNLNPNPRVKIYAKLEGFNPTGSIKDRIALKMIEQAEREGALTPGKTIIEPTSGNTGIGLAMIGTVKGYAVEIVMSEAVSIERRKMIQAFGATVTLTDPTKGTDGAIIKARELVRDFPDKYFMPDQFSNQYNQLAHYDGTAREMLEQMGGRIDYFVSALGTSGTLMGVGLALKERLPAVKIVSAHPVLGHYIQGLKNLDEAIVPAIYDAKKIDRHIMIESEDAFDCARRIAKEEGIFVGMSSGAAMWAALALAKEIEAGTIVTIFPDRGEKYLSTALFQV
ncbi:MAG TPA: cysteine synthase family protein [Anaeromyxobacteraceae bacterium]|nr:cysteine synthase family protein [Anaeromyxobacteraceae bacterium]